MSTSFSCKTLTQALTSGAALGLTAALVYGLGFVLYGIARTSLSIIANPANELLTTLLANALSVFIGAMFFAVLFGLFAALFQAVTLALVFALARWLNPAGSPRTGAVMGLLVALGLFSGLLILLRAGPPIITQVFWNQSFLFWFGLPGALFLLLNTWLGSRLAAVVTTPIKAACENPI